MEYDYIYEYSMTGPGEYSYREKIAGRGKEE